MKKAIVFLAEGFEEVEAISPIDYLRRAEVDVTLCAVGKDGKITGAHGSPILCDVTQGDLIGFDFDAVILPGGMPGAANLAQSEVVKKALSAAASGDKIIAAICAAPIVVLMNEGLLKGKKFTCYPGMETMGEKFCGPNWAEKNFGANHCKDRVVCDKNLITACGPGAAEEFSLKIVETLCGKEKMAVVAFDAVMR